MKKRAVSFIIAVALITASGFGAFAAEENKTAEVSTTKIVPTMEFTGAPIKLTLADTIKHMKTESKFAKTAELNKEYDKAIASGYSESVKSLKETLKKASDFEMYDTGNAVVEEKIAKLRRDFAKAYIDNNYQADMNKIENNAVTSYNGVLEAMDQLKVAQNNLKIEKELFDITKKKFDLGVASKNDLLAAQTAIKIAETNVQSAEMKLKDDKMDFNIAMGYPVMKQITFVDRLKEMTAPTVKLEDAIKKAIENRMEIKSASLIVDIQDVTFAHMKYTIASNSSEYIKQKVQVLKSEQELETIPAEIEKEVRSKYMDVQMKKAALDTAKENVNLAKNNYKTAVISYEAGLKTLPDVQKEQLNVFESEQALSNAVYNYNMAIYAFNYSYGVGTERIAL